jgi:hypothetical protein
MRGVRAIALVALVTAGADALPDDSRPVSLVPWHVLERGEKVDAPLVLFWIPASREELRRSPLLTSDDLTLYSDRCVAMRVVRADDAARLASLQAEDDQPRAMLVNRDGQVIATVESDRGVLSVHAVEQIVRSELDHRVETAESRLADARNLVEAGDEASARALYEQLWEERCVCPRQAKAALRALKKLEKK